MRRRRPGAGRALRGVGLTEAERYLELGLRLGRHVDGLVDAYYGPAELKEQVDAEEIVDAWLLAGHADALAAGLPDGWLRDQVRACATYARVLAGEPISYADEVEACYGVRPERTPVSVYEEVHAELDELLPGSGSLFERRQAWRDAHLVDGEHAVPVMTELLPILRECAASLVELPAGERATIEAVRGEPWWAFNYYQGGLESRIAMNVDIPTTGLDLIHVTAHEVYPGHHTERAVKERRLLRDGGRVEEGIQLVPAPQALLSEGIAELGPELAIGTDARAALYRVLERHGIRPDPDLDERIAAALEKLGTASVDVALMIHEDGASSDEAERYLERWRLATPEQAVHGVRFVTSPTWRGYAITYTAGERLCRAYVDGEPARFERLLTEHVRVGELVAPH
ncbi:MAG TPA: hypothetical protein VF094_10300 [Gaiellaceae bacterium]